MNSDSEQSLPPRRSSRFSASAVGLTLALAVAVLGTRGHFGSLFEDIGVKLPTLTAIALSPIFAGIAVLLCGLTIIVQVIASGSVRAAWKMTAIGFGLLLGAVYTIGMFRPLVMLIEDLSS